MLGMMAGASLAAYSCTWVHPTMHDVRTIYYQGVNASQAQVSKYTGSRGFVATTGEHIVCKQGFDVIENPFIGKELDEVSPKKILNGSHSRIKNFFHHPVRVIEQCINNSCENKVFGITVQGSPAHRPTTLDAHSIDFNATSLGQNGDIAEHKTRYDLCITQYPDSYIILYGVSRGAATTFNACASNQYDMNRIKLIVLEGCFDSVAGAVHDSPLFWGWDKLEKTFLKTLAWMTKFKEDGIAPIKLVDAFPENVPVLFVASKCDAIVPLSSTQRLVNALYLKGKNPIYSLVLQHSSHPKYMIDNKEDTENYRDCLHALYKHLDLPYIAEYAESGQKKGLLLGCLR
jgi:hypothetical protein